MAVKVGTMRPGSRCVINGHICEITRQARRSTFVRIVESRDSDIVGQRVQLPKRQLVKDAAANAEP